MVAHMPTDSAYLRVHMMPLATEYVPLGGGKRAVTPLAIRPTLEVSQGRRARWKLLILSNPCLLLWELSRFACIELCICAFDAIHCPQGM